MKRILVILTVVLYTGCSKSTGDSMKPVIDLQPPTVGTTTGGSKYIAVVATVNDDDEIHEVHLDVTNQSSGEVMHYHYHPDASTFVVNEQVSAASGAAYKIKVEADDHSGNSSEKEAVITVP